MRVVFLERDGIETGVDSVMERYPVTPEGYAALQAELGSMKDRLANVERIVTDSGYHLTHEIENLRGEKKDAN